MPELYMRVLDRILSPVLLIMAIWLFLRGHNSPGGGFIAALAASAAIQLRMLSRGSEYVRTNLGPYLHPMTGVGLLLSLLAASIGFTQGGFFKSVWRHISLGEAEFDFGTPVLFDFGVFLVVVSVVTTYLLGLNRVEEVNPE